ncbi:MAG: CocE/NonD family hydrolase [Halobacteriales archaeon]|nr:CocE/NonD family hydrolase [Halobacteriales archaeon]
MSRRAPALTLALLLGLPAALLTGPAQALPAATFDVSIPSFDGTVLAATVFVPEGYGPFPVVLRTHGWAQYRETSAGGTIQALLDRHIAVVTWDSRGFGASQGVVELDSPEYEVRDVSAILDWLSASPPFPLLLDAPGDPRAGMSGVSYAGGIQLLSAALEPRLDAIAPEITWNDLSDSLAPNGVLKLGWTALLYCAGEVAGYLGSAPPDQDHLHPSLDGVDPQLTIWFTESLAANGLPPDVQQALLHRSARTYLQDAAHLPPTLLVQGERDTLFTPAEAMKSFRALQARGVPSQLLLHGGGHGYSTPDVAYVQQRVAGWLDYWLQANGTLPTDPVTVYRDWDARWAGLADWPTTQDEPLHLASFLGAVFGAPAEPAWGPTLAGVLLPYATQGSMVLTNTVAPTTYREVPNFNDMVPLKDTDLALSSAVFEELVHPPEPPGVAGAAHLHLVVTAAPDAELFVKVLDVAADGTVSFVGNQATPLRMPAASVPPGTDLTRTFDVDLVGMVHSWPTDHHKGISISTTDDAFAGSRVPGPIVLDLGQSWVTFPTPSW